MRRGFGPFIPLEHLPGITPAVPSGTPQDSRLAQEKCTSSVPVHPTRDIKARHTGEGKPGKATPFLMEMVGK